MNESELFHCRNEPRRSATKLLLLLLLLPAQIFWGAKSLLGLFVVPRVGGIEEDFFLVSGFLDGRDSWIFLFPSSFFRHGN